MDLSELKKLLKLFENSKVSELELEQDGSRLLLKKGGASYVAPAPHAVVTPVTEISPPAPPPSGAKPATDSKNHIAVSPMVGTFYRTPSPTSPSFVEEGDHINKGQALCIIEAMKLMNEIESEVSGKIVRIFPENGKPVEFGEKLFEIEIGS